MRHFVWPRVLAGWPGASKLARVSARASAGDGSGHGISELTVNRECALRWAVGGGLLGMLEIRGEEQREE